MKQFAERVDLDVRHVGKGAAYELDARLDREERRLVLGAPDHADDDTVEDVRRTSDHVDVPVSDRIVGAGADRGDHGSNRVRRFDP